MNRQASNASEVCSPRTMHSSQPKRTSAGGRAAKRRRARKRAVRREMWLWLLTIALTAVLALGVRTFVFELVRVEGSSMGPTLQSGDILLVTKFDYIFTSPQRGDVVVCRYPNRDGTFVKRIVGLPGDTIMIRSGRAYVNDELLEESFVSYLADTDYGPVLVGDGQYLVMGDNRAVSHDSRADDVGTLRLDCIIGLARSVIYPLNQIRTLTAG